MHFEIVNPKDVDDGKSENLWATSNATLECSLGSVEKSRL